MALEGTPLPSRLARFEPPAAAELARRVARVLTIEGAIVAALVMAVAVRASHVLRHPFPLNDGGLFYVMANDIQDAGFRIPAYTSYNGGDIPFAYPPLAMWLAAVLEAATPFSMLDTFQLLPLAGALFATWAFYRLASAMLGDRLAVLGAVAAFAVAPRAYIWLVMGGGLPRGFGLAFALLALEAAWRLRGGPLDRRQLALVALFSGLTIVTHLETAAFLAFSLVLVAATAPRTGVVRLGLGGAAGLLLAAPWALLVVSRHGLEPFLQSANHGGKLLDDGALDLADLWTVFSHPVYTSEPWLPVVGVLALAGIVAAIRERNWFLPAWFVLVAALGMRGYLTFMMAPSCLLAGLAISRVLVPAIASYAPPELARRWTAVAATAAIGAVFFYGMAGAVTTARGELTVLRTLPAEDRAAMAWVAANTDPGASFAVMPTEGWHADSPVEWFPALTGRFSIATPQGYEWVEGAFGRRESAHWTLYDCSDSDAACLAPVVAGLGADYLYVPRRAWEELRTSLRASDAFETVYDSGDVMILRPVND